MANTGSDEKRRLIQSTVTGEVGKARLCQSFAPSHASGRSSLFGLSAPLLKRTEIRYVCSERGVVSMKGPASTGLTVMAPAKVNLTLAVRGRRSDGFHDLESWITPVTLCDEIVLRPSDKLLLEVRAESDGASLPSADAQNLVWQAAEFLAAVASRPAAVEMTLLKRIPMEAGLGGGSSDAAATLLGLNALWGLQWPREKLLPIAEKLGSDVPVFLHEGPAIIRGRGECVEPLQTSWRGWLVLIVPEFGLSTPKVFARWSETHLASFAQRQPIWEAAPHNAKALAASLFNDLTAPAFDIEPRLRELVEQLADGDGVRVHMTGSGSTLFVLFDSEEEAEEWREETTVRVGARVRTYVVQTTRAMGRE